ncbi:MAG: tetratricopeptide repeat protein [Xanthomonadales bacterium]|nr:tetratricopeptide repeat protein [Xanthomonadales bacterium]
MSFIEELKRRNVIRVAIAYAVTAWLLLQLADVILGNIDAPGWVFQVIMLVLGIGFPIVIIFAWAFEMTPEGIKREKDVDRSQSITPQTGRKLDRAIIAVLAVAVVYLLVDKLVLQKGSEPFSAPTADQAEQSSEQKKNLTTEGPSVAVLPFVNMSGDANNEYFSDGLTETLLHMLAQLPDLRVAARTSSFAFKGRNENVTEIANQLGVAHILEGSVQKADNRVRVTAQLIKAEDGSHVWSQNYTRPLEDIFAIQDEIAADVSEALGASLLAGAVPSGGVDTRDLSAYDSYLKGLEQQAIFSYTSLESAESHFERALALDADFNDARLSLIRNYLLKNGTGLMAPDETRAAIEPLIRVVRETDADNPLARALELTFSLQLPDPTRTAEDIEAIVGELRGLLLDLPTETYIRERVAAVLNGFFDDSQTAIEVLQAGLMVDPLAHGLHGSLGDIYEDRDDLVRARAEYERAIELAPGNPNYYADMSELERSEDNLVSALEWMRRATEVDPQDHELVYHIVEDLYALGLAEAGEPWFNRIMSLAPGSGIARSAEVQRAYAAGQVDRAIALAERAIADRVDTRQGAFFDIIFLYGDMMTASGRGEEAWAFLQSTWPEVVNYGEVPPDFQGLAMQWISFPLRLDFQPQQALVDDWNRLTGTFEAMGFPWKRDPADENWIWDYLLNGQTDKAIEHYLEHRIDQPLARNLRRHLRPMKPLYGPVWDDPRVANALADEDRRLASLKDEVRDLLQGEEWQ